MIIKILLLLGIALFGVLAIRGRTTVRHVALRRLSALLVLAFGFVGVLRPAMVTRLAHIVGVGRGTDLVLYVLVVAFLLTTATLLRRITELERRSVTLARHLAILQALQPSAEDGAGSAKPDIHRLSRASVTLNRE
jgi:hypothetical protein